MPAYATASEAVADFGLPTDGVSDATAALKAAIQGATGTLLIPPLTYVIAGAGADAGGVDATISRSLTVIAHGATFVSGTNLDNDMIRISVPSGGTGLPAEGIDLAWYGGTFDQSAQRNSTSMPFTTEYPPANLGSSATCDGLSIRGTYVVAATPYLGIRWAHVEGVTFYAGDHWETAGGDSGLYLEGAGRVTGCRFTGNRDLAVYASGDGTDGTVGGPFIIEGNHAVNCFYGFTVKRSASWVTMRDNYVQNSIGAYGVDYLIGDGSRGGSITNNRAIGCNLGIRLRNSTQVIISGNQILDSGATDESGDIDTLAAPGLVGIQLAGSRFCTVTDNRLYGVSSAAQTAYASSRPMLSTIDYDPGDGDVSPDRNWFIRNHGFGWRQGVLNAGDYNSFVENESSDGSAAYITDTGTGTWEVRLATSTNTRWFRQPVWFPDGDASAPSVARGSNPTVGMFFATSKVALSALGVERFAATNNGVAFNGGTPAIPTITGSRGGNAALASLLTAIASMGLIVDGTS